MNRINQILAGALVVQLLLAIVLLSRDDGSAIGDLEAIVPDFDEQAITRIEIFSSRGDDSDDKAKSDKGDEPAIVLAKDDGTWVVANHHNYPAQSEQVDKLLESIATMRARGPIAKGTARQKQLDVAPDDYRRKVILHGKDSQTTVYIGSAAGARQTSVRLGDDAAIYGVAGVTAQSAAPSLSSWVDTSYFKARPDEISSFDVVNDNGSFTFEREGETWRVMVNGNDVQLPPGKELDTDTIDSLLNAVGGIRLQDVGDPSRTIDAPLATVTVRLKGPEPQAVGDAGPAVAEPGPEYHIDFAKADQSDRTYVRVRGNQHAALVDALSVTDVIELAQSRLVRDPAPAEATQPGPGMPGHPMMPDMPTSGP